MQQLNSLYRGDQTESLGQIMGGQYAPQAQLNNFTSNWAIAGMQGAGATQRTAMQIASQEGMAKRQLGQQSDQFSLTHALNLSNQEMAAQAQKFGQQKDVAVFGQTATRDANAAEYQKGMAGAAGITANAARANANTSAYATMVAPGVARKEKIDDENLSSEARWDMYMQELTGIRGTLDPKKEAGRITGIDSWLSKLSGWKTHANSRHYLNAYKESRLSDPVIGIGMNTGGKPTRRTGARNYGE